MSTWAYEVYWGVGADAVRLAVCANRGDAERIAEAIGYHADYQVVILNSVPPPSEGCRLWVIEGKEIIGPGDEDFLEAVSDAIDGSDSFTVRLYMLRDGTVSGLVWARNAKHARDQVSAFLEEQAPRP